MKKLIKKEKLKAKIKETENKIQRFNKNIENYNKKLIKISKKLIEKEVDLNKYVKEDEYRYSIKRMAGENTYYELCDYEILKGKIKEKEEKIKKLETVLSEYNSQYNNKLYSDDEKDIKKNIPPKLTQFLQEWRKNSYDEYIELIKNYAEEYIQIYNKQYLITKQELEKLETEHYSKGEFKLKRLYSDIEIEDILNNIKTKEDETEYDYIEKYIKSRYIEEYEKDTSMENSFLYYICEKAINFEYNNYKISFYNISKEKLNEILNELIEYQKDIFVDRVIDLVGEIKNLSNLKIGLNSAINGIVIGEKASVKVSTIIAGGYNIQRTHYRVLVNKI